MRKTSQLAAVMLAAALVGSASVGARAEFSAVPEPQLAWSPRAYACPRAPGAITIDGAADEDAWDVAQWTHDFVDITGSGPTPRFRTRAKMLWDDLFFYVAAEMEEPHLWGTLTERDAVIYHDNDFEVFIDPDGDTHEYYELEVNALDTVWDLLLIRPYRDGGPAVDAWDIQGLETGVRLDGTLNEPGDVDDGWTVEIAIPWAVLDDCAHRACPPRDGDRWRVNFSRVEWRLDVADGSYVKRTDEQTGDTLPEDNWVWSPQGLVAMHYPEMWGVVEFVETVSAGQGEGGGRPSFPTDVEMAGWDLRTVYYGERTLYAEEARFTERPEELELEARRVEGHTWPPTISVTPHGFEASVVTRGGTLVRIDELGRLETEPAE